ncbi:thioesterase domain-containing protein [Winogradskyella helgolandensis]|uniref:thioesterase domain-containing protein n=1 Tax=Winogradskyella helgolandensis TaxID=2697010 RepID=UPI0015B86616|nr:alpha/beta fold hydrolase [Winogradskyella helgolandensis]
MESSKVTYTNHEVDFSSLVPLKPCGNRNPLFILHGANHDVLSFKNLADELHSEQPVYALQAKGLKGDSKPHDTVEDMAAYFITIIKTINKEGPYILSGFSFGGIIAFEMAKQLKAQGERVKMLLLFDSYVYPSYYYSDPLKKKVTSKLYTVGQLGFMGLNMFSSVSNFKRRVKLLKIKFSGLFLKLKHGSEQQYQLQFNRSSKIDKMHGLAYARYHIIPQDIEVDLFRSTKKLYFAHDYNYLGWKRIALDGVHKHILPGNHSEMFFSPVVEKFGEKLQNLLDDGV